MILRDNWIIISKEGGNSASIPASDLYCIVIDNLQMSISIPVLRKLAENKTHVIICDDHHLPIATLYPSNPNYHTLHILNKQLHLSDEIKSSLWQSIVKAKIRNQATCLDNSYVDHQEAADLLRYAEKVSGQDEDNLEGQAARKYFTSLYFPSFRRDDENPINSALNYGYAIIRSCMAKALVSYGFNCVLGIHHCSQLNEFNLADDLMEPFRPIIDQYVFFHLREFESKLTKENRSGLINIVNHHINFKGKKQLVRNAIDLTAKSLASSVEYNQPSRLSLSELIHEDSLCD